MSNNQNLLGGGKKAGAISLNMSGQTTPMPQTSSLEEKTKTFKFELQHEVRGIDPPEVQSDATGLILQAAQEVVDTQGSTQGQPISDNVVSHAATTQAPALDKYQHADQPENAEPDATQMFKENLALLEASFGSDKEAVAANVRNCMVYLQDHPELRDILQPEDVQKMVRGLRTSYSGIASSKRNKTKKKVQTSKEVDEMVDLLSGFDLKI